MYSFFIKTNLEAKWLNFYAFSASFVFIISVFFFNWKEKKDKFLSIAKAAISSSSVAVLAKKKLCYFATIRYLCIQQKIFIYLFVFDQG